MEELELDLWKNISVPPWCASILAWQ